MAVDEKLIKGILPELTRKVASPILATTQCADMFGKSNVCARFDELYSENAVYREGDQRRLEEAVFAFSTNLLIGAHAGWTTLFTTLQVAYWMGFEQLCCWALTITILPMQVRMLATIDG